jgi:hypothetical protein
MISNGTKTRITKIQQDLQRSNTYKIYKDPTQTRSTKIKLKIEIRLGGEEKTWADGCLRTAGWRSMPDGGWRTTAADGDPWTPMEIHGRWRHAWRGDDVGLGEDHVGVGTGEDDGADEGHGWPERGGASRRQGGEYLARVRVSLAWWLHFIPQSAWAAG